MLGASNASSKFYAVMSDSFLSNGLGKGVSVPNHRTVNKTDS